MKTSQDPEIAQIIQELAIYLGDTDCPLLHRTIPRLCAELGYPIKFVDEETDD